MILLSYHFVSHAQEIETQSSKVKDELEQVSQNITSFDSIATDFSKPISVSSDDQEIDGINKTSIFIDNVVITQGSLEINANRIEANRAQGNGKEVITATGKPATYKQRLENGTWVAAQAQSIVYMVETKTITLKGAAKITQNQSRVCADTISYNMLLEKINANSDDNSKAQVNTIISVGENESQEQTVNENGSCQ